LFILKFKLHENKTKIKNVKTVYVSPKLVKKWESKDKRYSRSNIKCKTGLYFYL